MYTVIEDVLPYFLALYVVDSLVFVRSHELLFLRRGTVFVPRRGGFFLAALWPHAEAIAAFEPPLRVDRGGVAWDAGEGWRRLPWDAVGELSVDERHVRSAGGLTLRLPSRGAAERTAGLLRALRDVPCETRLETAASLAAAAADVEAVRRLREAQLRHARPLSVLGAALLAGLFGLLPLGAASQWRGWPPAAVVLLVFGLLHVALLVFAWRTLRGCGLAPSAAAQALAPVALFPPAAAHVRSLTGRDLYVAFDALAVAAVLLPRPAFVAAARERYHALRASQRAAPHADDVLRVQEHAWRRVVVAVGLDEASVLRAPTRQAECAASYCPVCSTEYRAGVDACADCSVPLAALDA